MKVKRCGGCGAELKWMHIAPYQGSGMACPNQACRMGPLADWRKPDYDGSRKPKTTEGGEDA